MPQKILDRYKKNATGSCPGVVANALDQVLDGGLPVKESVLLEDVDVLPAPLKPAPIRPTVGQHHGALPTPTGEMDE